ncbi:MAG TPA: DUF4126 family protein [Candidatus Acidoferrales bacterium]|jgi:uncharacterized membrane protein|nr:DUF4126 family protein [Candidatus Acidoferrales bacterium]
MSFSTVLISALLIGFVCGLRALTAPAVVAWAAHRNWIDLSNTRLHFMSTTAAVAIFTLLALGEFIADQLPSAPNRTDPAGLIPRIFLGALCGAALLASETQSVAIGSLLGAAGGVAGAFSGYFVRTRLVKNFKIPDFVIATLEDVLAIGAGIFVVSRFYFHS